MPLKEVNPLAVQIGKKIQELRAVRGLKQETLALEVGYGSRSAIASIENGLVLPSLAKVRAIARVLGVRPGDLLEDSGLVLTPYNFDRTYQEVLAMSPECRTHYVQALRAMADDVERMLSLNN